MGTRFFALNILTGVFQLICVIALVIGLFMLFGNDAQTVNSNPFQAQVPVWIPRTAGSILSFYGLMGLVFSGGINVLISVEENTHALREKLPAALAALENAIARIPPAALATSPKPDVVPTPQPPIVPPAPAPVVPISCPNCDTLNDPGAKFCEHCGGSLART